MANADVQRYKDLRKQLNNLKGNDADDPEYLKLNKKVSDAAKKIPWYRR